MTSTNKRIKELEEEVSNLRYNAENNHCWACGIAKWIENNTFEIIIIALAGVVIMGMFGVGYSQGQINILQAKPQTIVSFASASASECQSSCATVLNTANNVFEASSKCWCWR